MHYYRFNIGDYASHTQHLDPIEDITYRRMLDWVYLHESPLPDSPEQIGRLIRMRSHCEVISVVLREFFELTDYGWIQEKAFNEIDAYKAKSNKAKESAKARWSKNTKSTDANALQTESEGNANHKPLTTNQEPLTKNQKLNTKKRTAKPDSFKQFFAEYPPNKKGGTDATAWKKAKSLGLSEEDFELMVSDIQTRKAMSPSWFNTYALGITRYMEQKYWLTPIKPDQVAPSRQDSFEAKVTERNRILGIDQQEENAIGGDIFDHD